MQLTNEWNRFIYRLWAPVYDSTVNRLFLPGRKRALEVLALQPGERVLIVGVGTGEDLLLLPAGVTVAGIDLSPEMLRKAQGKLRSCAASVELIRGDAQAPLVEADSCDAAILNLILSVIPDGRACLRAALNALKPGGRIVIFDKFLADGTSASPARRFINVFSVLLGTDINRRLGDMLEGLPCEAISNEPSIAGGLYRVILLCKRKTEPANTLPSGRAGSRPSAWRIR